MLFFHGLQPINGNIQLSPNQTKNGCTLKDFLYTSLTTLIFLLNLSIAEAKNLRSFSYLVEISLNFAACIALS